MLAYKPECMLWSPTFGRNNKVVVGSCITTMGSEWQRSESQESKIDGKRIISHTQFTIAGMLLQLLLRAYAFLSIAAASWLHFQHAPSAQAADSHTFRELFMFLPAECLCQDIRYLFFCGYVSGIEFFIFNLQT